MEKVFGMLIMTLLELLQFFVSIIFYYLILIIQKTTLLVLDEGLTEGIDGNVDSTKYKLVLTLVRQM